MTATTDPKTMARVLRAEVHDRHAVDLTHSQCLEIVARQLGADSWNVLAATLHHDDAADGDPAAPASTSSPELRRYAWGAASTTIPVMRVFSVDAAKEFYVDFLGFTLDFGGPAGGPGTPFYGQVTRQATTLHLTEQAYDPRPGTTVLIQMTGLQALWEELNERRETVLVWGPAVWVPDIEVVPWGAHTLTIPDPFGNHLRFNEPDDPAERVGLPVWAGG
jgi:catechol 2,3-dioxygenase-like lactoylglutathione lyase family enzyme